MVSVIIPVFNAEKFLKESIDSILKQTYHDLEILICDDCSQDNSWDFLNRTSDPRIKLVRNDVNQGYLKTINRLLSLTTGEYIAFHDADDVSHPKRIEQQVNFLQSNPGISLVGTNFAMINVHGKRIAEFNQQVTDPEKISTGLIHDNFFQKPSILFRRTIYEKVGGFREGFLRLKNISEDYDWLLRAAENFRLSNINHAEPLYFYRSVPAAMTKQYIHVDQNFGHKIAQFLAQERRLMGMDSMDRGDWDSLTALVKNLRTPYEKDKSLFYYERAESLLYSGLSQEAVKYSFKAVLVDPMKFRNVRSFLSCVKRSVTSKFS